MLGQQQVDPSGDRLAAAVSSIPLETAIAVILLPGPQEIAIQREQPHTAAQGQPGDGQLLSQRIDRIRKDENLIQLLCLQVDECTALYGTPQIVDEACQLNLVSSSERSQGCRR